MNKQHLFIIISTFLIMSCNSQKEKADFILHHAKIYSVDKNFSTSQAMAIKDGIIISIGTNEEILNHYSSDNLLDASGDVVYPGFNDAHCHFYGYGTNLILRADLVGTQSFDEVIERLKAHDQKYPADWVQGRGWDQNDWEVKQFPTKEKLDEAFPDKPVYLIRIDGHAAMVNSVALKMAGISAQTHVEGGEVILEKGEPSGVLIDNASNLVSSIIPEPNESTNIRALLLAQENCFKVGLTSVSDAGLETNIVELIDSLQKSGTLKMRINAMLSPTENNDQHFIKNGPYRTDFLTVSSIKLYADGALGSRGAKLIEPYSDDPGNSGLMMNPPEFYDHWCQLALENNYQVCTHAIGDGGNRFILNTYAKFLIGKNDKRWRIEHAQVIHPDDFKLFGKYSIIPSVQPTHATSDMYWAEERLGSDRVKGAYAYKQLLGENGWLPLGTDFPIESINPLFTFYAAVARQDQNGWPDKGFQRKNALSREEALRGMTIWAAKASFEENKKGSLEKGKVADFVILNDDLMNCELATVPGIKIKATYVNGKQVY